MRPQKLTMQAFGSYGQKTIIDFTKTDQNLFLVDVYKRQHLKVSESPGLYFMENMC